MKTISLLICHTLAFCSSAWADEVEEQVEKPVDQAISIYQETQKREDDWRVLREKLTAQFDSLQRQVDHLAAIKKDLTAETQKARSRLANKQRQLEEIRKIESDIEPYLADLVTEINSLSGEGLPFLMAERRQRFDRLNRTMGAPEISLSEKYRKAMEVLQIEAEFGLTIETSQETIAIGQEEKFVNIFRLGRVGLYYITLDGLSCGFFNIATDRWEDLDSRFVSPLQTAVAIADKRRPVEFLDIPLGNMVKK